MSALPTIFGDGVTDVHIANGVARITFGAANAQTAAQPDQKPAATGMLIVPVMQLPALARVLVEVTRQIEQRAKAAAAATPGGAAGDAAPAADAPSDAVAGAFRFNG